MFNSFEKKMLAIKGITRLRFKDESLLRMSFQNKQIEFFQSYLYLLRASHSDKGSLGYKYINNNLTAVIGFRHNLIYITPITDLTQGVELQNLCDEIATKLGYRVLLKKFKRESFSKIKLIQKQNLTEKELEDDACPETIIRLAKIFSTKSSEINSVAQNFKRKVNRFSQFGIQFDIVEDIHQISQKLIMKFFTKDSEMFASYYPIISFLYSHGRNIKYKTTIFLLNNKVQGVYVAEVLSQEAVALYCAVTARNKPGITEWMDWYFFYKMFLEGKKMIFLGGAENKGINQYIKKLLPERTNYSVETVEYNGNHKLVDINNQKLKISSDLNEFNLETSIQSN